MKNIVYILALCLLASCSKDDTGYVATPTPVELEIPANFPDIKYNLSGNPLTKEGIELGKSLFYDGRLSSNGVVSCGFCHEQAFSFTHHGHSVSHGVNGEVGFRNSQPLHNLAFYEEFTWDGAAIHLDLQPIIPITSEVEMNETIPGVLTKLRSNKMYQKMFKNAFGDSEINSERMLKALSQFMITMISGNSKYDKHIRDEGISLTQQELEGLDLFNSKCASCHQGELFTDQSYKNNGLPLNNQFPDEEGRKRVTGNPNDFYKFRVPSLRNVALSFPYMHDGRFGTLQDVLDYYDSGMVDNGNVDPSLLREDGSFGITLSESEKKQIISFLKTLTDNEFIQNKDFAEY